VQGKPIEIQVRTALQHGWAEFSEALDRAAGGDIKYGGGPAEARETLDRLSDIVATLEQGKRLDAETSPWDLISALGMMLIGYMAQRRGDDQ
jgi:ppGpp synthetase/RelA/SpoT-type nucleotidyltranferase